MQKLHATTELAIADISAKMSAKQAKDLKADPSAYISTKYGIADEALDIKVVENSDSVMNLSLPFYSSINAISAITLDDEVIDEVAGGEIMTTWSSHHTRDEWRQDTVSQHGQEYWDNYSAPEPTPVAADVTPNTTTSSKSK